MICEDMLPPPVMQAPGSWDCGLCAVKYILNRSGLDADLDVLRHQTAWNMGNRRGNWPTDLITTLVDGYGFERLSPQMLRAQVGPIAENLSKVRDLLNAGWIGLVNRHYVASIGHYLVIDATDAENRLLVTCSMYGRRWWTLDEFFGGFDGKGDGRIWWLVRKG